MVQVIDYGTTSAGVAYLVMEFLRGETLSKRLKVRSQRRSAFPLLSILQLGFQVADALACAHANGIIHRDLKPDNLMLVRDAIAPGGERVKDPRFWHCEADGQRFAKRQNGHPSDHGNADVHVA